MLRYVYLNVFIFDQAFCVRLHGYLNCSKSAQANLLKGGHVCSSFLCEATWLLELFYRSALANLLRGVHACSGLLCEAT